MLDGLLIAIGFPQAAVQDLCGRVMDLLPAVETAALAQGTHRVGEGVVDIVEPRTGGNPLVVWCPKVVGLVGDRSIGILEKP